MKENKKPTKEEWRDALYMELVRAAVLENLGDPPRSEDEAALMAFWRLQNPFREAGGGAEDREKAEISYLSEDPAPDPDSGLPPIPPRIRWLTAHVHPREPLTPSVDDLLLYDRMDLERGACSHFILDGFHIKKIR